MSLRTIASRQPGVNIRSLKSVTHHLKERHQLSGFSGRKKQQLSKFYCTLSQGQEQPQEPEEVEQEEIREPEIQTDTPAHADAGLVKPKPLEVEALKFLARQNMAIRGRTTKKDNPKAHYVHCHAHALNLAIADSSRKHDTQGNYGRCQRPVLSYNLSQEKPHAGVIEEMCLTGSFRWKTGRIVSFCPTRWTVCVETLSKVLANYSYLLELWPLVRAESSDPTSISQVIGGDKDYFIFELKLDIKLVSLTYKLSKTLQTSKLSAVDKQKLVKKTIDVLETMKEQFLSFKEEVDKEREQLGINLPKEPRAKRALIRYDETNYTTAQLTSDQTLRKNYKEVLDLAINGIKKRFRQEGMTVYSNIERVLTDPTCDMQVITKLCSLYQIDRPTFESELFSLHMTIKAANVIDFISTSKADCFAFKTLFPTINDLLVIIVLPATNASSERSFSAFKRLKTAMRNSMGQQRLNHPLWLHA
ncbi:zinc finger MYM-type protein 1-like [Watersipora subatra]|uniref:zinc finger MYM-type protein 1-like n=1 Tax=Watersipora subatra TaxID=2589382 RepID=UPI00355C5423